MCTIRIQIGIKPKIKITFHHRKDRVRNRVRIGVESSIVWLELRLRVGLRFLSYVTKFVADINRHFI
jgi:hypothetical protein